MTNLRARASDGVILVTSVLEPRLHEELRRLGVPLVVIDPAGSPTLDVPTVGAANWAGGMAATEHLLGLGHRRIGFVAGPVRLLCSRARLDGYRAALDGAGVAVDDALIVPGTSTIRPASTAATRCSTWRNRRPPCSRRVTRWRSGRSRRCGGGGCGCPRT